MKFKQSDFLISLLVVLLISPYLVLGTFFFLIKGFEVSLPANFPSVFAFTTFQAALSALVAVVLGIAGSFGLIGLREKMKFNETEFLLDVFILLPNAVPVLFVILAALNLMPSLKGLAGIVTLHSAINIGLVAMIFETLLREKAGAYLELARVEGAKTWMMIRKIIIPILWKDILILALGVFALSFASFAIPLIIGGTRATTTEVLIFELIKIEGDWSKALVVAILQALTILALSFMFAHRKQEAAIRATSIEFLKINSLVLIPLLPSCLLIFGLLSGVVLGFQQLFSEIPYVVIADLFLGSAIVAVGTAVLSLFILLGIAFIQPDNFFRKVILGLVAPSSVLTGFAIIVIWRATGFVTFYKIIIGLTLIFVPILYRLGWNAKLLSLQGQVQTATVLGASRWLTFKQILWPQLRPQAAKLAALASFWAWGDFALSEMVSERTLTAAMMVETLMASYRLNSATALLWLLLVGSGLTYFVIKGVINVTGRKPTH